MRDLEVGDAARRTSCARARRARQHHAERRRHADGRRAADDERADGVGDVLPATRRRAPPPRRGAASGRASTSRSCSQRTGVITPAPPLPAGERRQRARRRRVDRPTRKSLSRDAAPRTSATVTARPRMPRPGARSPPGSPRRLRAARSRARGTPRPPAPPPRPPAPGCTRTSTNSPNVLFPSSAGSARGSRFASWGEVRQGGGAPLRETAPLRAHSFWFASASRSWSSRRWYMSTWRGGTRRAAAACA